MNKREYCESRESVAYFSGLSGLEIKGIEYGAAESGSTVARFIIPLLVLFSGFTGIKSRWTNVSEWGV